MTEKLFLDAPAQQSMTATVIAHSAGGVVLDRTVFYARSGGQPGDTGVFRWGGREAAIGEAIKGDGESVVHPLTGDLPPIGAQIEGIVDWTRRYPLMRMHTALHLLCAVLPGAAVTGGSIGGDKSRLDLDLPESPDRDAIEASLNALVAADHPVSMSWVDESVLDTNPELVRTLSVKPPRGTGRLRLVRIGGDEPPVDLQPCGGTHVARTGEVGTLAILKIENKGRQNRRIVVALAEGKTP